MKIKSVGALALAACVFFVASDSWAIVTEDNTIAESNPNDKGYSLDWSYVYRVNSGKGGTGVAVDRYWLLTAAHVADDINPAEVQIGATTYTAAEVQYHPDNVDLALLRFSSPIFDDGHYELYTGNFPTARPQRLTGLIVGFGRTGTVSDTYYTPSGSGENTKRWGTNMIDGTLNSVSAQGFPSHMIYMNFDLGASDYEAGAAIYDSGGPVFVDDGGTWKVAGINVAVGRARTSTTPEGSLDRIYAARMPEYEGWVTGVVPEPSTGMLFALPGLGAALYRRRTFRRTM